MMSMTYGLKALVVLAGGLAAVAAAAATVWAGGTTDGAARSEPASVAAACETERHAAACGVALAYLAALDLDRGPDACVLLAPSTLEAAGGIEGCSKTIAASQGIRIRYTLLAAARTNVGTSIRFTTQGESDAPITQDMLVQAGRIVAVVPALGAAQAPQEVSAAEGVGAPRIEA